MLKQILYDPAFIFLIAINAYCIWYYQTNPDEFNTLLFLYWGQSVLIGLFNFVDMLTVKNVVTGSMTINNVPADSSSKSKGCTSLFFLFHYGIFHLVYGIYIFIYTKLDVDLHFILIGLAAFSLNLIVQFVRHKQWQQYNAVNIGSMFILPYLRIIPMHLMILIPIFFHWKASVIFLILKAAADIIMYVVTSPFYKAERVTNESV